MARVVPRSGPAQPRPLSPRGESGFLFLAPLFRGFSFHPVPGGGIVNITHTIHPGLCSGAREAGMRKTGMLLTGVVFLTCALAGIALAKTDGASVYQRCVSWHTSAGSGIGGVLPPLAGHAAKLGNADRTYPIQGLLFGLRGEIEGGGKKYNRALP